MVWGMASDEVLDTVLERLSAILSVQVSDMALASLSENPSASV